MDGRTTTDDVKEISSELSIILDLPPSCIDFSPAHPDFFVVGTYYLESESGASQTTSQSRTGSLTLYKLRHKEL